MRLDDVPGENEAPRPCRCDSSLFMTATPFLLCVFGKNDVLLAMPSTCCSLSRRSFRLPAVKLLSDAGRILLFRVFSRNPRWCEASVPKLSERQATPLSTISARYCVGLL